MQLNVMIYLVLESDHGYGVLASGYWMGLGYKLALHCDVDNKCRFALELHSFDVMSFQRLVCHLV